MGSCDFFGAEALASCVYSMCTAARCLRNCALLGSALAFEERAVSTKKIARTEEWNHDIDHVHVMFKAQPTTELSKFINAYKSASSRLIKKEFPFIKSQLWKEYFWSRSFCLLTSGGAPIEVLRQYIESQGSKSGIAH